MVDSAPPASRPHVALRGWKYPVCAISALGLAVSALVMGNLFGSHTTAVLPPAASSPPPREAVLPLVATADCDSHAVSGMLVAEGWTPGDFTVGVPFDLGYQVASTGGQGSFSSTPLVTKDALMAFLHSNTPAAHSALAQVEQETGASSSQALDPGNWVGFQLLKPAQWTGNTVYLAGQGPRSAGTLTSAAGDAGWGFVNPAACESGGGMSAGTQRATTLRAGCGNNEFKFPSPVPPAPTCPPGTSMTPNGCLTPKDRTKDVQVDPGVPQGNRGSGSTAPGANAGPATQPTDSPTGCNGPCAGSAPTPAPSEAPPSPQPQPSPIATQPPQSTPVPQPPPPSE